MNKEQETYWSNNCLGHANDFIRFLETTEYGDYISECMYLDDGDHYDCFSFYFVTENLANVLDDLGGCVFEILGVYIWGRATTGQSVFSDEIVQEALEQVTS